MVINHTPSYMPFQLQYKQTLYHIWDFCLLWQWMTDSLVSAAALARRLALHSDAETAISVKLHHIKLCADKPTWGPRRKRHAPLPMSASAIWAWMLKGRTEWLNWLYSRFWKLISVSSTCVAALLRYAQQQLELSEKVRTISRYVLFDHIVHGSFEALWQRNVVSGTNFSSPNTSQISVFYVVVCLSPGLTCFTL